jgi:hypothetical protein
MKNKHLLLAGAFATVLLAGCASEAYVSADDGYHQHRHWRHREYRREYVGRPPEYYRGDGVDVYVAPPPAHRYRW